MRITTLLLFIVGVAVLPDAFAEGDTERGEAVGYTCLGCHGIEGYNNAYPAYHVPRLGGQKQGYVERALRAYRDGSRQHPTMQAQGSSLSDDDIESVAAWLSQFGSATDAVTAESVAGIDAAQMCAGCHGDAGIGVAPQPPTLSGQHQDYLKNALEQYRKGSRSGTVMSAFAASLSEDDIEAVTAYYASQDGLFTVPSNK